MTATDANTAALNQHMAQQDRADRDFQLYRHEAFHNVAAKVTTEQINEAFWDDPAAALGNDFEKVNDALDRGEDERAGRLMRTARHWLRYDLVSLQDWRDEAAKLAAEDRQ